MSGRREKWVSELREREGERGRERKREGEPRGGRERGNRGRMYSILQWTFMLL